MTLASAGPETDSPPPDERVSRFHVLRGGGVEVVLALRGDLPEVLHWGAPLGDVDLDALSLAAARHVSPSALDAAWPLTVLPSDHDGWQGRPGLSAQRAGRDVATRWTDVRIDGDLADATITARSPGVELRIDLSLDAAGVLRVTPEIRNTGVEPLDVAALEATMPVGDAATEVLDFSGRWTRERSPQRGPLTEGTRVRETRRGRTGHDAPLLLALGTAGFDEATGTVWAVHLAWSADAVYRYDALPEARTLLGAGALLRGGEITLPPDGGYRAPTAVFVWSDSGLDGLGNRLHRSLRARAEHPSTARPVTLNTWEAVYFQHDLSRLVELAGVAAEIGVERFVLDDGWFRGRRSDAAGLGDWVVDEEVWPGGLHPLVDVVRSSGMQFGLWVEPEMTNLDSDLARTHPEWLLQDAAAGARTWRNQYVLDVAHPAVFDHLLTALSDLVTEYRLDFIKWDQNRDLIDARHDGRATTHRQTVAVYALLDELRRRHPGLEIESCASGGARVDLGILERTDRVWASDTNDPVERLDIQRWTELLLPPELIGAHVGPPRAHTTGRATSLELRIATALFGSFGIEWDITGCSEAELDELRQGIAAYTRLRPLIHSGELTHPASGDEGLRVTSVVAADAVHALVRVARVESSGRALPRLLRVPGLQPDASYTVRALPELVSSHRSAPGTPPWMAQGEVTLTGSALAAVGVQLPLLGPGAVLILELRQNRNPIG